MPNNTNLTTSERFFFDNNGYLVLEKLGLELYEQYTCLRVRLFDYDRKTIND